MVSDPNHLLVLPCCSHRTTTSRQRSRRRQQSQQQQLATAAVGAAAGEGAGAADKWLGLGKQKVDMVSAIHVLACFNLFTVNSPDGLFQGWPYKVI